MQTLGTVGTVGTVGDIHSIRVAYNKLLADHKFLVDVLLQIYIGCWYSWGEVPHRKGHLATEKVVSEILVAIKLNLDALYALLKKYNFDKLDTAPVSGSTASTESRLVDLQTPQTLLEHMTW